MSVRVRGQVETERLERRRLIAGNDVCDQRRQVVRLISSRAQRHAVCRERPWNSYAVEINGGAGVVIQRNVVIVRTNGEQRCVGKPEGQGRMDAEQLFDATRPVCSRLVHHGNAAVRGENGMQAVRYPRAKIRNLGVVHDISTR